MTDTEFDVLDELYFVQSFEQLSEALDLDESELIVNLNQLKEKGWVKFMKDVDDEWTFPITEEQIKQSYFLATKAGLLAHNS